MNRCAYYQSAMAACDEMRMEPVVCPKPRRLGLLNPSYNDQIRPLRWPINHQAEIGGSQAEAELMDIIFTKERRAGYEVASSPPFFSGSPPSRASNPVVQDEQFGNGTGSLFWPSPRSPSSSSSSARKGGRARMKFGHKPAAVRIEGFDCLSRDRRSCSISAVA